MFGLPGWAELLLIAFVGLLLFGKRLPEVARSLGQSVVEFKRGMQGFKNDMDRAAQLPSNSSSASAGALPDQHAPRPASPVSPTSNQPNAE